MVWSTLSHCSTAQLRYSALSTPGSQSVKQILNKSVHVNGGVFLKQGHPRPAEVVTCTSEGQSIAQNSGLASVKQITFPSFMNSSTATGDKLPICACLVDPSVIWFLLFHLSSASKPSQDPMRLFSDLQADPSPSLHNLQLDQGHLAVWQTTRHA